MNKVLIEVYSYFGKGEGEELFQTEVATDNRGDWVEL